MKKSFAVSLRTGLTGVLLLSGLALPCPTAQSATVRASEGLTLPQANNTSFTNHFSFSADATKVAFESNASNLVGGDTNRKADVFVRDLTTGVTTRVSVDSSGAQGNGRSFYPSLSNDGSKVAFQSDANNLVSGDTNATRDVFLRDLTTGITTRVSLDSSGAQGNSDSQGPSLNADGSKIAFFSSASNLVNDDTNSRDDVFVRDLTTGLTTRVSVDSSGVQGNRSSDYPSLSGDGSKVTFDSLADNLVSGDTNNRVDVFAHDLAKSVTTRVSVDSSGAQGNSDSLYPSLSGDGTKVAFFSFATNLVTGDTNGEYDVFVRELTTGVTTRASVDNSGVQGNRGSSLPSLSNDGSKVAFESSADNLVSGDTNATGDIFVRDLSTGITTRISVDSNGTQGNGTRNTQGQNGSLYAGLSGDGSKAVFISFADNLVSGDTNGFIDVFVRDLSSRVTTIASVAVGTPTVVQGNGSSTTSRFSLSADGKKVAFASSANNLVSGDTNGFIDVFVRDLATGVTTRVSIDSSGTQGNGNSYGSPSLSNDGSKVAFESDASNLVSGDTNNNRDVFVRDLTTGVTTRVSVDSSGGQGNGNSHDPSLNADGSEIAFFSFATNLVSDDTNGKSDIFVRDLNAGLITRVSVNSSGTQGNDDSYNATLSDDGGQLVFSSLASNLVSGDTNNEFDVFVRDMATGSITRASVNNSGVEANSGSFYPSLSGDGSKIAFYSHADNLVSGDTNGKSDVFVRDMATGAFMRVSVDSSGRQANGDSYSPSLSSDGSMVAFESNGGNLVSGDTNGAFDIFGHDLTTGVTTRLSVDSSDMQGNGDSRNPSLNAAGTKVAYESSASNLVTDDTNSTSDAFVSDVDFIGAAQSGSDFVVTTTGDHDDGTCSTKDCTLREAINAANANTDDSAITFQSGLNGTIRILGSALPDLSTNLSIDGSGATMTVSGRNNFRVLTISNGTATGPIIGISRLKITQGSDYNGAGIVNNYGTLTINNSTLSSNSAGNNGGAIFQNGGSLNLNNSTLSDNTASQSGAGIYVNGGMVTLSNDTFSGNDASLNGGAISNFGNLTVQNSTFSANHASGFGGGLFSDANATLNLSDTIVAGNSVGTEGADISGTLASGDYNLVQDTSGATLSGTHNVLGQAANLGSLANNGGPTQTFALLAASPALNAGDPAFNGVGQTDQRGTGFARVQLGRLDIGALEVPDQAPTAMTLSNNTIAENCGANATVGILNTTDADIGDTLTYMLPTGRASNGLFAIAGDILQAKVNLNYEKKSSYVVLVQVSDSDGLSFQKKFTINVTDTNDAPVLDSSGNVQMTVSANGKSITDLLQTGAYTAPISDEDTGALQGISVYFAESTQGVWQFSLDGGRSWNPLGTISENRTRLLASDGANTRLRFLPNTSARINRQVLRFFAWDQSNPSSGDVNGAFGDASAGKRGGKSAFSLNSESLSVAVPGQSTPQLTITTPTASMLVTAPTEATGTASGTSGIVKVRCLALYRTKEGANNPGYWNGDTANPQFLETNMVSSLPVVQTSDGFAHWIFPLPLLTPGQYRLRMEARDAYGQTTIQIVTFVINDETPQVAITSPQTGTSYTSGTGGLNEVAGTASDADDIVGVTVYLYRKSTVGNAAGYWNGDVNNPIFAPEYDASINEVPALNSAMATDPDYSTWRLALPQLSEGNYSLRATAHDSKGNFSGASAGVVTSATESEKSTVSFTIIASNSTPVAVAYASSSSIIVEFNSGVPTGAFAVTVKGASAAVQSTVHEGKTVTLLLAEGTFKAGDKIGLSWNDGNANLIAE